jgi:hypothetical protein
MLRTMLVLLGAALTSAGGAVPLSAQAAPRAVNIRGLHIGIDPLVYATLSSDYVTGGRTVGGLGLQIRGGWSFTEKLSLVMDVSVSNLAVADTAKYLLSSGDVMLRYTPVTFVYRRRTVAPYVGMGVGLRDISAEGRSPTASNLYELAGEALAVSAGVSVYVSPDLSVFVAYHAGFGDFNDERSGNVTTHRRQQAGESHRIALGLTWHKGRAR